MPADQQRMGLGVQHRFKPTVCEHAHPLRLQRVIVAACDDAGCSCDPECSARCDKRAEQRAVRPMCSTHALATHRYSTSSHSVFRASEEAQRQSFLDCTSTHSKRAPLNPACDRTESTHFLLQTQRGPRAAALHWCSLHRSLWGHGRGFEGVPRFVRDSIGLAVATQSRAVEACRRRCRRRGLHSVSHSCAAARCHAASCFDRLRLVAAAVAEYCASCSGPTLA